MVNLYLRIFVILTLQSVLPTSAFAQSLTDQINSGTLQIVELSGNGSSSGAALEGTIRNISSSPITLDVYLLEPVYFRNTGQSQNMVATQVYEAGGSYFAGNGRAYISIPANAYLNVMFIAYCADFELDNPGSDARFSVGNMPSDVSDAARQIASFEARNPNIDTTVSSQVALWLSQGLTPQEIQSQFSFTSEDLSRAQQLLRY